MRRESAPPQEHPGALRADAGALRLQPAPVRSGGPGPVPLHPGPLAALRAPPAPVLLQPSQDPQRPLAVNRLADHPDVHTCPACGPPARG
ncbi:hypothetical protein FGE12_27985 [Aggregicoccus sp. 17bor-14]|uniref:hypothetical protein n=1 Tax=Myxococcaceae TaxID=31 RepID=UPI00129D0BEC|nr:MULTISPECIES: hypothetical protein [Myxococcaceae]MBF5046289.1 hypothetical protein [Simulacricoccus sp. 17bor-14]MRI92011.1 hypothetical protein [Aggregicoccus sp. 17bor-14]